MAKLIHVPGGTANKIDALMSLLEIAAEIDRLLRLSDEAPMAPAPRPTIDPQPYERDERDYVHATTKDVDQ